MTAPSDSGNPPPKDPFAYAHAHRDEIVWMSQNTNHLPTDPRIKEAMVRAVQEEEFTWYPKPGGIPGLADAVRADLGLAPEWDVLVQHGGLEAAYVMSRALVGNGDNAIASDPSFLPLHQQVRLGGGKVKELPIYQPPWKLTVDQVNEAIDERTRLLFLIDPLNPLGTQYTRDEVKAFAEMARDRDIPLVHDVTYRDFAYEQAQAHEFAPEHTLYVYSFSKNAGFAGLRVGALAGPRHLTQRIRPCMVSTLGVNVVAQRAALTALQTKDDWLPGVVKTARDNQRRIKEMVDGLDGCFVPVYPSSSNILVIDVSATGADTTELEHRLLFDHGVFVRGGRYVSDRFGDRFVRVSFTVPTAGVDRFVAAFPKALEATRTR